MPAVPPTGLLLALLDAIGRSGGVSLIESGVGHPRRLKVVRGEDVTSVWVYLWTLTPGGRPNLPNEYRIQMTGVKSPLRLNPEGPTVLLGFEPNLGVLAGFDTSRHMTFTEGSPSVQIDISALYGALQDGLGLDKKSNSELAVGIRPDMFLFYVDNSSILHQEGGNEFLLNLLNSASKGQTIPPQQLANVTPVRRRLISEVSRLSRSARFRQQVLQAYDHRCAVTRMQLRLVEAAHILPVAAGDESLDHVTNGIALSPTYHAAYDQALIYLTEDYRFQIDQRRAQMLENQGVGAGLVAFRATLGRIHLPPDPSQRPNVEFIRKANRFRGIS